MLAGLVNDMGVRVCFLGTLEVEGTQREGSILVGPSLTPTHRKHHCH